jgi:hypothetical protein
MPSSESTRKIVLDRAGRITALSDELRANSRPLKIGDQISFETFENMPADHSNLSSDEDTFEEIIDNIAASVDRIQICFHEEPKKMAFDVPVFTGSRFWPVATAKFTTSKVMAHAIETFGSEAVAREWLTSECGALNNQAPTDFIKRTGNEAEVERILGCIDHGMLA